MVEPSEQKKKKLIVLVGTSIFSSASWQFDSTSELSKQMQAEDEISWTGYKAWCEAPLRNSPKDRVQMCLQEPFCQGERVTAWVEKLVRTDLEALRELVAIDEQSMKHSCLRYSAEIATLLKLWLVEGKAAGFTTFLNQYHEIEILCSDQDERQVRAASAVCSVLDQLTSNHSAATLKTEISGNSLGEQSVSTCQYVLSALEEYQVDVIVSGGYKVFAIGVGFSLGSKYQEFSAEKYNSSSAEMSTAPEPGWRLIYMHESEEGLLVRQKGHELYFGHDPVINYPEENLPDA